MDTKQLLSAFESRFGRPASHLARAPGRVNLIGEHTDYNDGFVLPIAINRQVLGAIGPRSDGRLVLASLQQEQVVEVDLAAPLKPGKVAWANYCIGVAEGLRQAGIELAGCELLLTSDVPLGAGLSSSAALEVATATAMLAQLGQAGSLDGPALALLCQKAENTFAGAPCGIMDQSISVMGQADHALLLDCRSGQARQIRFDRPDAALLVCDTKVKHSIGDGGYPARRRQCESAAAKLGVKALRDVTLEQVQAAAERGILDSVEQARARHVVTEIARTTQAAGALEAGDYETFGQLMYASHGSLRDDYEVSCEELDAIVETASHQAGVLGARMTGGGFGGCAIVLAQADAAGRVGQAIEADFVGRFGHACPIFATRAEAGAGVLF